MYDIIVVGAGPAGLTAALYARRAEKTVLVIEKATFGGQITHSPRVENYPGFAVMSGVEFADKLVEQAMDNGVEIKEREVNKLDYPSRTRWNRMNGYEQDEYEKRIKAAGKKTVYSINGFEFPKTVVDYAKFYKENGKSKTESEKPSKSEIAIKNKATSLAGAFGYSKTYATKMGSPFNLELAEQTVDEELDWDDGSKKALKEELRRIYSEKKVLLFFKKNNHFFKVFGHSAQIFKIYH